MKLTTYKRPMTGAERMRRARERQGAKARTPEPRLADDRREHIRLKRQANRDARPFVAFDTEGYGEDETGRQVLRLLRVGAEELWQDDKPLKTKTCLDFLCRHLPHKDCGIGVGYAIGYDVAMILRDMPTHRKKKFMGDVKRARPGTGHLIGNFMVWWVPNNFFRVARAHFSQEEGRWIATPDTHRTIYDVFGFFNSSFLAAIEGQGVGAAHWEAIEAGKADRGKRPIDQAARDYCGLECDLLAELMERFRARCIEWGVRPRTWSGAGKLAAWLHDHHGTVEGRNLAALLPAGCGIDPALLAYADAAYYGGRMETFRVGRVPGPVYERDQRSAYPAAMTRLPCLLHGAWEAVDQAWLESAPADALFVATVRFRHDYAQADDGRIHIGGLPVRRQDGRVYWPVIGGGTYWSAEIRAAVAGLGARVAYGHGWAYRRECDCQPFAWVERHYAHRQSLDERAGYPIKIAINALTGKFSQRHGTARWRNPIYAGLVTAMVRADLIELASQRPGQVVMLATDAVFTTVPLEANEGEGLGMWRSSTHAEGIFVMQPGLYWGTPRPRTRGIAASKLVPHVPRIEAAWSTYAALDRSNSLKRNAKPIEPPSVEIPLTLFRGLRLAHADGHLETAGTWVDQDRGFSFRWTGKRRREFVWCGALCVHTYPILGGADLWSNPYHEDAAYILERDADKLALADQPEPIDLTPPFRV